MESVLPPAWEKIRFHAEGDRREFSELDERDLVDAVAHLRKFLGDDFPAEAYRSRHALLGYFVNDSPWTRFWIIEFDKALRLASRFSNSAALANRMRNPSSFHEALSILECASTFAPHGFDITLEPQDLAPNFKAKPDLLLTNSFLGGECVVEVTTMGESREWVEMMQKYDRISRQLLFAQDLATIGRLKRTPSEPRMKELEKQIQLAMDLAREHSTLQPIETPELDAAVAPQSHRASIREWGKHHGVENGSFVGPSTDSNLMSRLAIRIREKIRQLPPQRPGLIWIELQTLGAWNEKLDYDVLEDVLHEAPHVLGAVITWNMGFVSDEDALVATEQRRTVSRKRPTSQYRFYRLLENEHATIAIPSGLVARLRRALGF